jgi:hypothetical protein
MPSLRPEAVETPCHLAELDGTPLASGALHQRCQELGERWVVVRLHRPGRMIERCLVGNLRQVLLSMDGGPPCRTELDRLSFDPRLGRVCVLRLVGDTIEEQRSHA